MKCNQWIEGTIEPHGLPYCRCGGDIPDQWRDVQEELPDTGDEDEIEVITFSPINGVSCEIWCINTVTMQWEFSDKTVTHWMPLPAPPSGKEE